MARRVHVVIPTHVERPFELKHVQPTGDGSYPENPSNFERAMGFAIYTYR